MYVTITTHRPHRDMILSQSQPPHTDYVEIRHTVIRGKYTFRREERERERYIDMIYLTRRINNY